MFVRKSVWLSDLRSFVLVEEKKKKLREANSSKDKMVQTQQLFEDNHVNDVVNDALDAVFQEFNGKLAEKELEALAIPFATDLAMEKIYNITRLATYQFDGEVKANEAFEKMEPDAEPYPSCIDSWARGTGKITSLLRIVIQYSANFLNT